MLFKKHQTKLNDDQKQKPPTPKDIDRQDKLLACTRNAGPNRSIKAWISYRGNYKQFPPQVGVGIVRCLWGICPTDRTSIDPASSALSFSERHTVS